MLNTFLLVLIFSLSLKRSRKAEGYDSSIGKITLESAMSELTVGNSDKNPRL